MIILWSQLLRPNGLDRCQYSEHVLKEHVFFDRGYVGILMNHHALVLKFYTEISTVPNCSVVFETTNSVVRIVFPLIPPPDHSSQIARQLSRETKFTYGR